MSRSSSRIDPSASRGIALKHTLDPKSTLIFHPKITLIVILLRAGFELRRDTLKGFFLDTLFPFH